MTTKLVLVAVVATLAPAILAPNVLGTRMTASEHWVAVIGEQAFGAARFDTHLEGVPGTRAEGQFRQGLQGVGYQEAVAWARERAERVDAYVLGDVYSVGRVPTADAERASDDEVLKLIQSGDRLRAWYVAITPPPGVMPQKIVEVLKKGGVADAWEVEQGVVRLIVQAADPDDLDYQLADLLANAGLRDVRVTINSSSQ